MSNEIKNYVRYFFKSNRRLLLLEFIILFVFIPFLAYNQVELGIEEAQMRDILLTVSSIMILLSTLALAFIMPIYTYRFIFRRQSSDLYFALPIKRGTLYAVQFALGTLLALIPLVLNCLLDILLICLNVNVNILSLLLFLLFDILMFLILYALVSFLVVKCNNLLDAVLIAGAYMIMPVFIMMTFVTFLDGQGSRFFVSNVSIISELIGGFGIEMIFGMLSLPATLAYAAIFLIQETPWTTDNFMQILTIYWIFVGILCFYFGRRTFMLRKEEDAQQRTAAIPTYPFIITLFTVCLMLLTFSYDIWSQSMMMTMIILFLLYIFMQMFAKRSLRLKPKDFLLFIIILVMTYGFSWLFQSTNGFGLLHEIPDVEKVVAVEAAYYKNEEGIYDVTAADGTTIYANGDSLKLELYEKKSIKKVVEVQKEIITIIENNQTSLKEASSEVDITLTYHMNNKKTLNRTYVVNNPKIENITQKLKDIYDEEQK